MLILQILLIINLSDQKFLPDLRNLHEVKNCPAETTRQSLCIVHFIMGCRAPKDLIEAHLLLYILHFPLLAMD